MAGIEPAKRKLLGAGLGGVLLLLSACDMSAPAPDATGSSAPEATSSEVPAEAPSETPPTAEPLDFAALTEREDPDRLMQFYAEAIRRGEWSVAALAWDAGAGVTGERLEKAYKRDVPAEFALGKGTAESAAGSQFYEAPVVVTFGSGGESIRGTLTVRRAKDVPGAGEAQLDWRIERSTIGPDFE